jgi:hypothetical protein
VTPGHPVLVKHAIRWLRSFHKCGVVFGEMVSATSYQPDAIGWHRRFSILVECKASRADFFADRKKGIHANPDGYAGEERWYLTPPGLVQPHELPDGWYLAECDGTRVRVVVHPPLVTPSYEWNPAWGKQPNPLTNPGMWVRQAHHERSAAGVVYLVSAVRRHQVGVRWLDGEARFESVTRRNRREASEQPRLFTMAAK